MEEARVREIEVDKLETEVMATLEEFDKLIEKTKVSEIQPPNRLKEKSNNKVTNANKKLMIALALILSFGIYYIASNWEILKILFFGDYKTLVFYQTLDGHFIEKSWDKEQILKIDNSYIQIDSNFAYRAILESADNGKVNYAKAKEVLNNFERLKTEYSENLISWKKYTKQDFLKKLDEVAKTKIGFPEYRLMKFYIENSSSDRLVRLLYVYAGLPD